MTERAFSIATVVHGSSVRDTDLTAKARIRDAALARFPADGYGHTTVRAVAADAGVSPALVVHHFGSKEGLRQACDRYVVEAFREAKRQAMHDENLGSASFADTLFRTAAPLVRYLGWALVRGHAAAGELFDEMVDEGVDLSRLAIDRGIIVDSPDLRRRVVLQMAMELGGVVLSEHIRRNLGSDLTTSEGMAELTPAMLEMFGGLFTPAALDEIRRAYTKEASPEDASGKDA